MRFDVNFCFAIDLVTAGAAGHGIAKQRLQNSAHRICLLSPDKGNVLEMTRFENQKQEIFGCQSKLWTLLSNSFRL
jgi:hypothetical protein